MNPLRLFSKVASSSPKKLSFDGVGDASLLPRHTSAHDHSPFVVTTRGDPKLDPLSACELLITGVASSPEDCGASPPSEPAAARAAHKRGHSPASEWGSPGGAVAPTPGKGKKTTPQQATQRAKGHYHRRSVSNFVTSAASDSPAIPPGRSLRQSASFSGVSTPRGGRPPTSGESGTPLSGTPRSAGKAIRYASSARAANVGNGDELRIELEEDPTFWQDHSVQVTLLLFDALRSLRKCGGEQG